MKSNFGMISYSLSMQCWIFITLVSICVTGAVINKLQKNKKYQKFDIMSLDERLKKMYTKQSVYIKSGTLLGSTKTHKQIYCADYAKHVLIAGTTGSGKTVAISNFILRATKENFGLLIIDGKGDTGESSIYQITTQLCNKYDKKLYIIDMNSPSNSDTYNPFLNTNATTAKDMLVSLSDWSEEHYRLNVERYLQKVISLMIKNEDRISLATIVDALNKTKFISLSKELQSREIISKQEHLKNVSIADTSADIAQDALSRFATILESEPGKIFDDNGFDIYSALREKAVILFILNPLEYPETSSQLGRMILIDSKKAVSKMFNEEQSKFFIFDEINVYASKALLNLVNKSRSANVTCILATQSLADLESAESEAFKQQVIENCNNYIIMRQNSFESAEQWAKVIGTQEKMKLTYQINDGESTGKGSARRTYEFIVHPDQIKSLKTGEAYFVSKDNSICEYIKIKKEV